MRNFFRLLLTAICGIGPALAGPDSPVDRKEFKQTQAYPYVFRPVCYLATQGPIPLRFSVGTPDCGDRKPPKLPPAAARNPVKVDPTPAPAPISTVPAEHTAAPAPAPAPPQISTTTPPAFPPPTNGPAPKPTTVDFSQFPAELVEAFKKGQESAVTRNYLFDPIFQPALPEDAPQSKATYKQK